MINGINIYIKGLHQIDKIMQFVVSEEIFNFGCIFVKKIQHLFVMIFLHNYHQTSLILEGHMIFALYDGKSNISPHPELSEVSNWPYVSLGEGIFVIAIIFVEKFAIWASGIYWVSQILNQIRYGDEKIVVK